MSNKETLAEIIEARTLTSSAAEQDILLAGQIAVARDVVNEEKNALEQRMERRAIAFEIATVLGALGLVCSFPEFKAWWLLGYVIILFLRYVLRHAVNRKDAKKHRKLRAAERHLNHQLLGDVLPAPPPKSQECSSRIEALASVRSALYAPADPLTPHEKRLLAEGEQLLTLDLLHEEEKRRLLKIYGSVLLFDLTLTGVVCVAVHWHLAPALVVIGVGALFFHAIWKSSLQDKVDDIRRLRNDRYELMKELPD